MVWFQCEDCGDNLKKPKLPNHFNFCSASKLSCIDCGQVFSQEDVDSHTQCITEAEKYGPKGHGKVSNSMNAKGKANSKQKPDVDIYVGLSERPPWVCSLCNTNTTSKQTLLAHADGKKHRAKAKAKAFHAANQQQCKKDETNDNAENETKQDTSKDKDNKKRKLEASENDAGLLKDTIDLSTEVENGKAAKVNGDVATGLKKAKLGEDRENTKLDCTKGSNEVGSKKLKWKKLISSALKSNPEGVLKFSKLTKLVLKSLEGSDYAENKTLVSEILERKISSSSRFILDAKYVRLASSASG